MDNRSRCHLVFLPASAPGASAMPKTHMAGSQITSQVRLRHMIRTGLLSVVFTTRIIFTAVHTGQI